MDTGRGRSWLLGPTTLSVVVLGIFFGLPYLLLRRGQDRDIVCTDYFANLRNLGALYRQSSEPLAADGRLDIYAVLLAELQLPESEDVIVRVCRNPHTRVGPTLEEIKAGDYTHFPYQRRRGRFWPEVDPPVPIFWEPRGTHGNGRSIGFSDGSVRFCKNAEADEIFRDNPDQE